MIGLSAFQIWCTSTVLSQLWGTVLQNRPFEKRAKKFAKSSITQVADCVFQYNFFVEFEYVTRDVLQTFKVNSTKTGNQNIF